MTHLMSFFLAATTVVIILMLTVYSLRLLIISASNKMKDDIAATKQLEQLVKFLDIYYDGDDALRKHYRVPSNNHQSFMNTFRAS